MVLPFFFFNDTATTEIYTLSLHDALPICIDRQHGMRLGMADTLLDIGQQRRIVGGQVGTHTSPRLEEHTSELQSRLHLVCRLLLEKKKNTSDRLAVHGSRPWLQLRAEPAA